VQRMVLKTRSREWKQDLRNPKPESRRRHAAFLQVLIPNRAWVGFIRWLLLFELSGGNEWFTALREKTFEERKLRPAMRCRQASRTTATMITRP